VRRPGLDIEDDGDDEVGCGEPKPSQNTHDPGREDEAKTHGSLRKNLPEYEVDGTGLPPPR